MNKDDKKMLEGALTILATKVFEAIEEIDTLQKKVDRKHDKKRAKRRAKAHKAEKAYAKKWDKEKAEEPDYHDFLKVAVDNLSAAEEYLEFNDLPRRSE
jgi:hypothetical protein